MVIIGLDCAEPTLVFDRFADRLPHLSALRETGLWGKLRSCDPPITVPAWMSMMSSKDPGTLGYYGFRNRADRSYEPDDHRNLARGPASHFSGITWARPASG